MPQSNRKLYGYYSASENYNSCTFFFASNDGEYRKSEDGIYLTIRIMAYALGDGQYHYSQRDVQYDRRGKLFIMGDQWIIQTVDEPPGCGGATGFFHLGPYEHDAFRYYVEKKITAIGIGVISRKAFFHDKRGTHFTKRQGFISPGEAVAVLGESGDFSLVQQTDTDYFSKNSGQVVTGWIRSVDLANPFP
jgi:hypothetical protein